jgi:hypothetical protein
MRSKWSRALRHVAKFKEVDESLRDFIKRRGGINACATRFARCLGRKAGYLQNPSPSRLL